MRYAFRRIFGRLGLALIRDPWRRLTASGEVGVSGAGDLSTSDVERLIELLHTTHEDGPGPVVPWALLEGLTALIPSRQVSVHEFDLREDWDVAWQALDEGTHDEAFDEACGGGQEWVFHFWRSHCSYPQRTGDLKTVILDTDFLTQRQWRRSPQYLDVMAEEHVLHDVVVSLPAAPGRFRRLVLTRDLDVPFTERDRRLLGLLRPHLTEIWLACDGLRNRAPQLTDREWEVLYLAGSGLSNSDIATHLFISTATVRKHLEHVFDKLGVRTRAAATAIALPHRPQPSVGPYPVSSPPGHHFSQQPQDTPVTRD